MIHSYYGFQPILRVTLCGYIYLAKYCEKSNGTAPRLDPYAQFCNIVLESNRVIRSPGFTVRFWSNHDEPRLWFRQPRLRGGIESLDERSKPYEPGIPSVGYDLFERGFFCCQRSGGERGNRCWEIDYL